MGGPFSVLLVPALVAVLALLQLGSVNLNDLLFAKTKNPQEERESLTLHN